MGKIKTNKEFEQVAILIEEARIRAFHKVNQELVLLYFRIGGIVSDKVAAGIWGDNTVDELASYIESKYPGLKGFNRRGLYRMKQFFETYSDPEFVSTLATQLQQYFDTNKKQGKVSTLPTQNVKTKKVTAVGTQLNNTASLTEKFVSSVLTQICWTNHRLILSKTKSAEEQFYYLLTVIKERYSSRELERA